MDEVGIISGHADDTAKYESRTHTPRDGGAEGVEP